MKDELPNERPLGARARIPNGVRGLAVVLGLLDIFFAPPVAVALLVTANLDRMYHQPLPASDVGMIVGSVAICAIGVLVVAVGMFVGRAWARLGGQLVFWLLTLYAGRVLVVWPARLVTPFVLIIPAFAAPIAYLENPTVRSAFRLEPKGIVGRHQYWSIAVVVAVSSALLRAA